MKLTTSLACIASLLGVALAQSPVYGQCGGTGWTGAKTCVSGSTCTYSNPYYSQCLPGGSAPSSTSKPATTSTKTTSSSAAPTSTGTTSVDTTSHCGSWDTVKAGPYTMSLDQWGTAGASGSQCSHLISLKGNTVAWQTTWTWSGGNGVKTFSNIGLDNGLNKQLGAIKSIPSSWAWTQTTSGSTSLDVAYDIFTANSPSGANVNEIMVWLINFNAGPIAGSYTAAGAGVPLITNLSIGGYTWNLYSGSNGANHVWSFLPANGQAIQNYSGDLNLFLKYLTTSQGVPTTQYLTTVQAGTEPTKGSATLTTSAYSVVIN